MSKLTTLALSSVAGLAATLAMATTAQAGCNSSLFCGSSSSNYGTHHTGTTSLPPLSSYFDYERGHGSSSSYSSYSSYGASPRYIAAYSSVLSESAASATYGSGSISSAYTGGDVEIYGFSGTPSLGAGESLQATSCPVDVIGAEPGSRVLGCYNVVRQEVRPVANTTYYRVVRPVIYVRYPVPVPVHYTVNVPVHGYGYGASRYGYASGGCGAKVNYSRYGGYGPQGGYGLGCR